MWRPIEQQKPKKCCVDFVDPNAPDEYKYLAPSKMTSKQNVAIAYFPACDQKMLGTYKLVVVVVTFEPGWGRTDLRTYTIDYGSVLELVDSDQAVSGDTTIDVGTDTQYSYIGFNKVRPFDENSESDSNISFNRTDDSYEAASQETVQATGANNVDLSALTKVKDPTIPTNVKNTVDGSYLWIITPEPISIAAEANSTINGCFATYIPLTKAQFSTNNNLYYYACPNPIKADKNSSGSNIYVKFK